MEVRVGGRVRAGCGLGGCWERLERRGLGGGGGSIKINKQSLFLLLHTL